MRTIERQVEEVDRMICSWFPDPWSGSVADWCCYVDPETGRENLRFAEQGNRGPFTASGREYIIESLNDWGDRNIGDCVEVFGSQTGKTCGLMAGAAWSMKNDPCAILWVTPAIHLAQSFSETRWMPMLRASPAFRGLIPERSDAEFKKLQQMVGNSLVNFVGSNSPANLAMRPARKVVLDEVDKFDSGGNGEADAVNLAEQRTKGQAYPQRRKTSTPTLVDGLIWQEFLKGDQRRYFVPCPLCGKRIVLAWSAAYTVLPKPEGISYVTWDKEAKRGDRWDLDRVERSARVVCAHCGGDIVDGHKTKMVAAGEWRPTAQAEAGFRSRHLPSLYACRPETTFGKLAVKFLRAKQSLMGLQGFINGDLAEPYESQDRQTERVELVSSKIDVVAEWKTLLTVDCQAKGHAFWHAARAWNGGDSHCVSAGPLDAWNEIADKQRALKIPNVQVMVDSGWGAMDDFGVYRECAGHCDIHARAQGMLPLAVGWMPAKGFPAFKRWKDDKGQVRPYALRTIDPFEGTAHKGRVAMSLFEFASDYFKDVLAVLRSKNSPHKWSVEPSVATEEYWRHLDCWIKAAVFNKRTGRVTHEWRKRSEHWPDHMADCENMQVALASFFGFLSSHHATSQPISAAIARIVRLRIIFPPWFLSSFQPRNPLTFSAR